MQRKIILKLFIVLVIFSMSLFSASLSSSEIINMVAEIKKERVGISLSELNSTEKPFIMHVPQKQEIKEVTEILKLISIAEVVYTLKAILNKAAFIDKKWYRKGDKLGDYTIGYVSSSSVILKSESDTRTLELKKRNKSLIKSNRGHR